MIGLSFQLGQFVNLGIFIVLSLLGFIWFNRSYNKKPAVLIVTLIVIGVILAVIWAITSGINHDESEHLHCIWMVSQGLVPFLDFWQHHSPLLWVIFAPLFKNITPSVSIFEWARALGAALFILSGLIGWRISKRIWKADFDPGVYLFFILCACIPGELFRLRPDIFMIFFLLLGINFSLSIAKGRTIFSFYAGLAFALALSFAMKQYLLILVPIIIIFRFGKNNLMAKLALYVSGLFIGCFPLFIYLIKNHIVQEFFYWVIMFNREQINISAVFPVFFAAAGILSAVKAFKKYKKWQNEEGFIFLIVFILGTLSSSTKLVDFPGKYYLAFWYILVAVGAAGLAGSFRAMKNKLSRPGFSLLAGVLLAMLFAPVFIEIVSNTKTSFKEDRSLIAELMGYCKKDKCFVTLPFHPIFNRDATRIYSNWQYYFLVNQEPVKNDTVVEGKNVARQIMDSLPAVMIATIRTRSVFLDLFLLDLISKDDHRDLMALVERNYTLKTISGKKYYIRNDLL